MLDYEIVFHICDVKLTKTKKWRIYIHWRIYITCSSYRCIKRRVGCSVKRAHCRGRLVPSRKQTTHKLSGAKSGLSGPKRVPRPLLKPYSPHSYREYNSGYLHKRGRREEDGPPMCLLWRILTWCARKQVSLKA